MGGGRVADGTGGTAFFLATFFLDGAGEAAFFLVAVANGAGERELRTSRAGPCCRGWSGAEEVAEGDGLGGRAAAAVVDGAGERELPLSMAAFFFAGGADGAGEREQRPPAGVADGSWTSPV